MQQVKRFFLASCPDSGQLEDEEEPPKYPYLAMVASLDEMFGKPIREIQKEFRISELTLLAWRSQERAVQMEKRFKRPPSSPPPVSEEAPLVEMKARVKAPAGVLDEDGVPDARRMTGAQLVRHLSSLGMQVPMFIPQPPKGSS